MRGNRFRHIKVQVVDVPVTEDQMIARMGLGAVQMFLFNGQLLRDIDQELKLRIINQAREKTEREKSGELKLLDIRPTHDSTLLFTGIKS